MIRNDRFFKIEDRENFNRIHFPEKMYNCLQQLGLFLKESSFVPTAENKYLELSVGKIAFEQQSPNAVTLKIGENTYVFMQRLSLRDVKGTYDTNKLPKPCSKGGTDLIVDQIINRLQELYPELMVESPAKESSGWCQIL